MPTATDLLIGLTSPETYHQMTVDQDWTDEAWTATVTDLLLHALGAGGERD